MRRAKIPPDKGNAKSIIPGLRGLFKAIKSFVEFADIMRVAGVNVALRLSNENIFSESAMKNSVAYTQLLQWAISSDNNGKNNSNEG